MNEEVKNNNEKELSKEKRFNALIKLMLWAIFIVFLLVIINLGKNL